MANTQAERRRVLALKDNNNIKRAPGVRLKRRSKGKVAQKLGNLAHLSFEWARGIRPFLSHIHAKNANLATLGWYFSWHSQFISEGKLLLTPLTYTFVKQSKRDQYQYSKGQMLFSIDTIIALVNMVLEIAPTIVAVLAIWEYYQKRKELAIRNRERSECAYGPIDIAC